MAVPEPATIALLLAATVLLLSRRYTGRARVLLLLLPVLFGTSTHADIYHRYTGKAIPGTEGIWPEPGVQLDHMELELARFLGNDLTGANFEESNLFDVRMDNVDLIGANLQGANRGCQPMEGGPNGSQPCGIESRRCLPVRVGLNGCGPDGSEPNQRQIFGSCTGCILTGATIEGASFAAGGEQNHTGLTKEQLYSTASYQNKSLRGVRLDGNNLTGWDFSGQDVTGTGFGRTTALGFTKEQLYSTASYQARDLRGVDLSMNDLSGWDFGRQHLGNADLYEANLVNANLLKRISPTRVWRLRHYPVPTSLGRCSSMHTWMRQHCQIRILLRPTLRMRTCTMRY